MVPEFPLALILHLVNIIMGYPIRIVIEDRSTEILLLEFIICIDDRLHVVTVLNYMQPSEHVSLEVLNSLVFGHMLNIKYRGQVAILKVDLPQEMIRLCPC